jgi:hypothetical protein
MQLQARRTILSGHVPRPFLSLRRTLGCTPLDRVIRLHSQCIQQRSASSSVGHLMGLLYCSVKLWELTAVALTCGELVQAPQDLAQRVGGRRQLVRQRRLFMPLHASCQLGRVKERGSHTATHVGDRQT